MKNMAWKKHICRGQMGIKLMLRHLIGLPLCNEGEKIHGLEMKEAEGV